ncbi:MAG: HAD-IIA family hydrolase [Lachnospiraceae bacterium]|nr:HAD-IIA family hydrolase [Lachnospiraceae bacterium]
MGLLKFIDNFALDMDGTIYLGEKWIDGAFEFLETLTEKGKNYVFLTNNSSKSAANYVEKLARLGLSLPIEKIITSGQATVNFLKREYPGKKVFLLGNEMLALEFTEAGIMLSDIAPEVVVVGFDTSLDYAKMCKVCDFVRAGLPYISTHPDFNCPTESGFIPDAGAIHAFIHASAFRYPDQIIGKPNREIMDYMLARTGADKNQTAMVGDRLYTDVCAGVNNGMTGILVLSGEATMEDVGKSEIKPDYIFPSLKEMIKEL